MVRPVVSATDGRVCGQVVDGVCVFLGIPYAAPPFGVNRFGPPVPPSRWDGVREALGYGPTAPKSRYPAPYDVLLADPSIPGEDCLNLNVWTPDPGGSGLPVMVWIHGGTFLSGSGGLDVYNGAAFARDGVVCVTINYRLGVEGFAELPGARSNRGLLDQIAALEWVQNNIAAFGGDPARVTIFGESAGAVCVTTLLSLDYSLFSRAIAQSGAGTFAHDRADALLITGEVAGRLGVEPTADGFAAVEPATIIDVQAAVAVEVARLPDPDRWGRTTANAAMAFMPVLDGALMTRRPQDAIADGAGAEVDLMIGYTTDEFRPFLFATGRADLVTREVMDWVLTGMGINPTLVEAYQRARPHAAPADVLAAIITDGVFRIPANRVAEGHAAAPTWMYEFAWPTPERDLGACHALELGFVFDNLSSPDIVALTGTHPPQQLATEMHRAWGQFATTGNPGWERFTPQTRKVKIFDGAQNMVVADPREQERKLW
ncbi:MAG TPA: carboxylesterase [Micromonosporaceae bacterium]|nr:carboxylesterase [Micromonosporaceae bacterium]HCU49554.1 carboxylesterase [Micromonosporaceae bacterium]